MLLYPERGLVLKRPAADDRRSSVRGEHTVGAIVDELAAKYAPAARGEAVEREVLGVPDALAERGLLTPRR